MSQNHRRVIEQLGIDLDRLWIDLDRESPFLNEQDREIVCLSLLGYVPQQIAQEFECRGHKVRDRLSNVIYPKFVALMQDDPEQKAGNWTRILNFLLHPERGYKLSPAPQLNSDNFQASLGSQIFLYPSDRTIVQAQVTATQFYQQGRYYQALLCFLKAWELEKQYDNRGNPETLIYLNNCLLESERKRLEERQVKVYTLAVVVPFYHNSGQVAAEILRGIAQFQFQVNSSSLELNYLQKNKLIAPLLSPNCLSLLSSKSQIALRILIVNDPNHLYDPYNQTAEKLAALADSIHLSAVLGHYSSEMTQKALSFYAKKGLLLINGSSTSDELSELPLREQLSFFRLTTPDAIAAERLMKYIQKQASGQERLRVGIIYNKNSLYSTSYRHAIWRYLQQNSSNIHLLAECDRLSGSYYQIQDYLDTLRQEKANVIIVIPDGGIEPRSLHNVALISRLNWTDCLIAGSATFYHDNILQWLHEQSRFYSNPTLMNQIIACVPWHWQSQKQNDCRVNPIAQQFCQLGTELWGEESLTWRSATAFDSLLMVWKGLENHHCLHKEPLDRLTLLEALDRYYKRQGSSIRGVTGNIQFSPNGDRTHPPSEIVGTQYDERHKRWKWVCLPF